MCFYRRLCALIDLLIQLIGKSVKKRAGKYINLQKSDAFTLAGMTDVFLNVFLLWPSRNFSGQNASQVWMFGIEEFEQTVVFLKYPCRPFLSCFPSFSWDSVLYSLPAAYRCALYDWLYIVIYVICMLYICFTLLLRLRCSFKPKVASECDWLLW